MDPSKVGNANGKLPAMFERMFPDNEPVVDVNSPSRIPIGQPISVPPSEKLHVKSNRSNIVAQMVDGNTTEIRVSGRMDDPGELARLDERLVLSLASRLAVDRLSVPVGIPILFELTEGSLDLSAPRGVRPARLSIVSIGAPVKVHDFRLVTGVHMIKSTGAEIIVILSDVQAGEMVIAVTGDDLTLELPKNANAQVTAQATKGSIQNRTSVKPDIEENDKLRLMMGAGKAKIALEAVNGTVCIKTSN
jgi:hypothetical protein